MRGLLIIISTVSIVFSQYNVYDINNYNYFQDSVRVNSPIPMFKSFIFPGWGQFSKNDPKWKMLIYRLPKSGIISLTEKELDLFLSDI